MVKRLIWDKVYGRENHVGYRKGCCHKNLDKPVSIGMHWKGELCYKIQKVGHRELVQEC